MDEQIRQELSAITAKLAGMEERVKAAFVRIDEQKQLAESVHKLALAMERFTHEQERMREDQERQRVDIDALRLKPGRRWETVTADIVKLIIAAVLGGVLIKFGL